jgi:hypothetical protein
VATFIALSVAKHLVMAASFELIASPGLASMPAAAR